MRRPSRPFEVDLTGVVISPIQDESLHMDRRVYTPEPKLDKKRKKEKKKKMQNGNVDSSADDRSRKGSRCAVM